MRKEFANSTRFYLTGPGVTISVLLSVLFCLFSGISRVHATTICDTHLMKKLEVRTRFVDAKEVAKNSAQQLQADAKMFADIRDQLKIHIGTGLSMDDYNLTERMIRNMSQYVELLERIIDLKRSGKPAPADVAPTLHLSVGEKSQNELFQEMSNFALAHTANPVVRYFPISRQDLALSTGTDRSGMRWGDTWDQFGLEATLRHYGLKIEDGMYSLPLDEMKDSEIDAQGNRLPFIMIEDFMRGERGFAIYDGDQLTTDGADFYLFANPSEKAKALKGLILPAR